MHVETGDIFSAFRRHEIDVCPLQLLLDSAPEHEKFFVLGSAKSVEQHAGTACAGWPFRKNRVDEELGKIARRRDLRFLGRLHNVEEALAAVELARATFPRLSFDLIYSRPEQTTDAWAAELKSAIDRAADHLSLYQLTIEAGTRFGELAARGRLRGLPAPDAPIPGIVSGFSSVSRVPKRTASVPRRRLSYSGIERR